jgi:heme A synthase
MKAKLLASVTFLVTFVLLIVGGVVHSTGSSLACPDWPLCYGQVFPEMVGGVLFEHSHRLLGFSVGVLTLLLCVAVWRDVSRFSLRGMALLGLVLVCLQAVLGGITVLLKLPMIVSTAHLATSMLFFSWLVYMLFRLGQPAGTLGRAMVSRKWVLFAVFAVYLQLVLGAVVRHTGSALACGVDVVRCAGAWLPYDGPSALHMLHRVWGVVTAACVIATTVRPMKANRAIGRPRVKLLGVMAHVLVCVQIALGMATVASMVHTHVVTTHLAVGALLLADMVAFYLVLGPLGDPTSLRSEVLSSKHPLIKVKEPLSDADAVG